MTTGSSREIGKAMVTGGIVGRLAITPDGLLTGWAYDPSRLDRKLVVEILADSVPLWAVVADCYCAELRDASIGDGCYGFTVDLEGLDADGFEMTLANDDRLVAYAERAAANRQALAKRISPGEVFWTGGLRLTGWISTAGSDASISAAPDFYRGADRLQPVLRLNPGPSDHPTPATQFDCLLPLVLADGDVHQIRVISPNGAELAGSPVTVFATPGSYSDWIRAAVNPDHWDELKSYQAEMLDRLIPQSVPFEAYPQWKQTYGLKVDEALRGQTRPHSVGVMILGSVGRGATIASLESQVGDLRISVVTIDPIDGKPGLYATAAVADGLKILSQAGVEAVLTLRAGSTLLPGSCLTLAEALIAGQGDINPALVLSDHELLLPNGSVVPFFGPAFDYERLWSQGYAEGLFMVSTAALSLNGFKPEVSTYDLILLSVEAATAQGRPIVHLPVILGTVPQLDVATAENQLADAVVDHALRTHQPIDIIEKGRGRLFPNVLFKRPVPEGKVAIIIPTRDRLDLLRPCLETLRTQTVPDTYTIHIIDNGSQEPATHEFLVDCRRHGIHVHRDDRPFNYAQMHNTVVPKIEAEFICLLNNDVEIVDPDWLVEMKRCFSRSNVGIVGAKLIWPNGMLQHGGVVLGSGFAASHAYDRYLADEAGYGDGVLTARECSAVTAACLLTRKTTFLGVNGFDEEAFPVAFNDVDFCLKVRAQGQKIVWTPAARLLHRESASRLTDREHPAKVSRATKELSALRARWGETLVRDPYYNPNLNRGPYAFTGLDCSTRSTRTARTSH